MGNLAQAVRHIQDIKSRSKRTLSHLKWALSGQGDPARVSALLRELRALSRKRAYWRGRIATTLAAHPEVVVALIERQIARLEVRQLYHLRNQITVPREPLDESELRAIQANWEALFGEPMTIERRRQTRTTVRWGTTADIARELSKRQGINRQRREAAELRLAQLSHAIKLEKGRR